MATKAHAFSSTEKEILVKEFKKRREILQCSFKDSGSNEKKKAAWAIITEKVNAVGGFNRDTAQIKKKWADMKSLTKKKAADEKRERQKTGGGAAKPIVVSPLEEDIISTLGPTAISGITGGIDSSHTGMFMYFCLIT